MKTIKLTEIAKIANTGYFGISLKMSIPCSPYLFEVSPGVPAMRPMFGLTLKDGSVQYYDSVDIDIFMYPLELSPYIVKEGVEYSGDISVVVGKDLDGRANLTCKEYGKLAGPYNFRTYDKDRIPSPHNAFVTVINEDGEDVVRLLPNFPDGSVCWALDIVSLVNRS